MHDFSPSNKLKTSILILQKSVLFVFTLGSPTLVKVNKAMKSGTLQLTLHSKVARRTKPHVVKSTDLHCILNTNINKCRREKLRRGQNVRSSPRQCIPATTPAYLQKVGLENSPYFCVFKYLRASSQTKGRKRGWKERARLGSDAKNTDCPFCIRHIRSNYPLLPATGNSHWLNFDASCQQAVNKLSNSVFSKSFGIFRTVLNRCKLTWICSRCFAPRVWVLLGLKTYQENNVYGIYLLFLNYFIVTISHLTTAR